MPYLLLGTSLGLLAAVLCIGAGFGVLEALLAHSLVGGAATLGIAFLGWRDDAAGDTQAFETRKAG